ncbi:MAG: hypothetical protein LAT57_11735 [Balneolales bacterium]|nr:hypothetical protein [Balneolales bacterium]
MIKNTHLEETLNHLITLENIISKEIRSIHGNRNHLKKIVPNSIAEISKKQNTTLKFTDKLKSTFMESAVIALLATFEKVLFVKYLETSGHLRSVVKNHSDTSISFYKSRERFIKSDVDKLHHIIGILDGHISADNLERLKEIKENRDYFSHGKRFPSPPRSMNFEIREIAINLDLILQELK